MGHRHFLRTEEEVLNFLRLVEQRRKEGKPTTVEFLEPKRSLDQNAMKEALYRQIAEQKQDESVNDIRRFCKLHYGVPILLAQSETFREKYDPLRLKLDYEDKLAAMDILDVTSLMNTKQCSEYIDEIIREFSKQGVCLLHPSEMQGARHG